MSGEIERRNLIQLKNHVKQINTETKEPIKNQIKEEPTRGDLRSILIQKQVPTSLICTICLLLITSPIQTVRGEIACATCYRNKKGDTGVCPIDNEPIKDNEIFPDRAKEREILSLQVKCWHHAKGCDWTGVIKNLDEHTKCCKFAPFTCEFCKALVTTSIDEHYVDCDVLHGQSVCPYSLVGCSYKPTNSSDLNDHLKNTIAIHAAILTNHMKEDKAAQQAINESLRKEVLELKSERIINQRQISILLKKFESMEAEQKLLKDKFEKLGTSNLSGKTKTKPRTSSHIGITDSIDELVEKLKKHEHELDQLNTTVTNISSNLSDVDLRHQLHENTTYDGKMTWKIDNFELRKGQAITGKVTALHSAPAFTSKYGYKFCCRLYLDGDGMGKGTHISIFFVLMKSEFDVLLEWPFTKRVTFTLINQDDKTRSIRETFIPDINSSSFKQPTKQMNVASGCPYFVSNVKLNEKGFIKDDCFFIEINVK